MTRAKNTASVISKYLPDVPVDTCDFLREGAPIKPVPESPNWRPEAQVCIYSRVLKVQFILCFKNLIRKILFLS